MRFGFSICLAVLFHLSLQKLTLDLKRKEYQTYMIYICFEKSKSCGDVDISFSTDDFVLFHNFKYKPNGEVDPNNEGFYLAKDNVIINEKYMVEDFEVKVYTEEVSGKPGLLGLVSKGDGSSFLDKLYSIQSNSLQVMYIDSKLNKLILGDYPEEYSIIKDSVRSMKSCDMTVKDRGFSCLCHAIFFKVEDQDDYINLVVNADFSFSPDVNGIYVSSEVINYLIDFYLGPQIKEGLCNGVKNYMFTHVYCNLDYNYKEDKRLSKISFIFGKFTLSFLPEELFSVFNDKLYFLVYYSSLIKGWTFGNPVLDKYYTIFSNEENKIHFIPKKIK